MSDVPIGSSANLTSYSSGLEADQKVLAAHGCYGMTATTALTAQNTLGVDDIHITPSAFVGNQIDTCLTDIACDAVKIGRCLDTLLKKLDFAQ